MKLALIQCPAWSVDRPPYALALLTSLLREGRGGHEIVPFDLNVRMYREAVEAGDSIRFTLAGVPEDRFGPDSWSAWAIEWDWGRRDEVLAYLESRAELIEAFLDEVLATSPDAIGFSVQYTSKHVSLELARRFKERDPDLLVLFGGPQCFPTCDADHLLHEYPFVDVGCFGEAEGQLEDLLTAIETGGRARPEPFEAFRGYQVRLRDGRITNQGIACSPPAIDLARLPAADWTWVDFSRYTRVAIPVITSRGCIRRCTFCSEAGAASTSWGPYRYRPAAAIADEIRAQHERHRFDHLWFTDSVFNGNLRMVKELCDLLIEADLGFRWDAQLTIRPDMTSELLDKIRRAGCQMLHWGLESGSDTVLRLMQKGYTARTAQEVLARTHEVGIRQNINLIVGHPGETEEHFQETLAFLRQVHPYGITDPPVAPCDVNRGSILFDRTEDLGIVFDADHQWSLRDGSNTLAIRLERKQRVEDLLRNLLEAGPDYRERQRRYAALPGADRVGDPTLPPDR